MAINSRSKGNKAERDLAKQLGEWTNKEFARTPSSGGLSWKNSNAKGDIVCTTEGHYFPLCVEVKFYKEIELSKMIVAKRDCIVFKFWEQCSRDAQEASKFPILFMRYNMMPRGEWMVAIKYRDYKIIKHLLNREEPYSIFQPSQLVIMNSAVLLEANYKKIKSILMKNKKNRWRS